MTRKRESGGGALARLAREWRPDRNPLRRRSDRAQAIAAAGLLAALLAGGPFAAIAGGNLAQHLAHSAQLRQLATERQVTAVTLQPAAPPARSASIEDPVRASWATPAGTPATGLIPVLSGTPAGTREPVWTSAAGQLAPPPLTDSQVSDLQTLGQATAAAALAVLLAAGWATTRRELNRRRYAAWDAAWEAMDHRGTQRT